MPNYKHQEHLVMDDIQRVESWDFIPIRLLRYETAQYYFPLTPGDTMGMIIKEDHTFIMEQIFKIRHGVLISYPADDSFFSPVLRNYGVSPDDQVRIMRQVSALARSMKLPIEDRGDIDMDMEEDQMIKTVPATKSSIDELERVGVDLSQDCSICLESLPIGLQVVRMPCSHVFHGDCIVKWLERSCHCPVCRFQMPCVD
ncbi:E3 ubiquitin-protein ligase SIRP1 [Vitis vinifera]|uniref:RING-type E3 ubiquitin transferase n=1 Tax=Vitis vinifera TaxID=29760 RepID=A0A438BWT1_VITVI|nr:E3 ubiquitin-protein ligase SIRP1 [Vitis vinifera]